MTQQPHKCEEALALMRANPGEVWRTEAGYYYKFDENGNFQANSCPGHSFWSNAEYEEGLDFYAIKGSWYRVEDKA